MRFHIVDVFAEEPYQGNELLVVEATRPLSDGEQQAIAREINFSETAFILSGKRENGGYGVHIWTPNVGEVPFAGHPSLGAAHVIREVLEDGSSDVVRLNLAVGQIPIRASSQGLVMSQNPPIFGSTVDKGEVAAAFGINPSDILVEWPVQWVSTGLEAVIVPLASLDALSRVRFCQEALCSYVAHHPRNYCNHLFFVRTGEHELEARCMMEGVVEDPATGSANGCLAAYLVEHNFFGAQEVEYVVTQGRDMGRVSILRVHAVHSGNAWTIEVGGKCHIVASGEWK